MSHKSGNQIIIYLFDFITKTLVVGHLRLPVNDQKENRPFDGFFSSFNKDPFLTSLNEHLNIKADTHKGFCSRSMLQAHVAWPVHTRGHTAGACSMLLVHTREQTKETWCGIADIHQMRV